MAQTAIQDSKVPLSNSSLNGPNNHSSDFNEMFWNNMFGSGIHLPSSLNIPMTPDMNTKSSETQSQSQVSPPSPSVSTTTSSSTTEQSQSSGNSTQSTLSQAASIFPGIGPAILPANPAATLPPNLASIPAIQNIQAKLLSGVPLSSSGSNLSLSSIGSGSRDLMKVEKEPTYVDVTPYLILPQHEAARRLGIPCSTLSKRWKEASLNRKWPYRIVCKLDKEITTLLKNVENSQNNQHMPLGPAVEETLALLLRKRQEELRSVVIRLA